MGSSIGSLDKIARALDGKGGLDPIHMWESLVLFYWTFYFLDRLFGCCVRGFLKRKYARNLHKNASSKDNNIRIVNCCDLTGQVLKALGVVEPKVPFDRFTPTDVFYYLHHSQFTDPEEEEHVPRPMLDPNPNDTHLSATDYVSAMGHGPKPRLQHLAANGD